MKYPTKSQLIDALERAGELHQNYEKESLEGHRDEHWAGFYAAYVLGRYDDFQHAGIIADKLEKVPVSKGWAEDAAEALLDMEEPRSLPGEVMYVCPHCFTASEVSGKCGLCGYRLHEFRPGDLDDPCRCPVMNEQGEVVTHAPLWWLRSVAPELAERMERDRRKSKS